MNKIFLLSTVAAMACFVCSNANAKDEQAQGSARVKIVESVAITHEAGQLDFGVNMKSEAHTVTVDPAAGTIVSSIPAQLVETPAKAYDEFKVTGPKDVDITIGLPESLDVATGLTVTSFSSEPAASFTIPESGTQNIKVGGVLSVGTDAVVADDYYTKPYTVTISY